MFVRELINDLKAYPATLAFCIAWILIFVAMVVFQVNGWSQFPWKWSMLMIGMTDGNQFGDLTIRDFRHGELWRLITCNFVHYGLLHLGLNLLAMYQLGAIVEDWYGSYQMVFIYAITGGLGNLVSVTARMMLGHEENIHSGGGSVVILGLVGLCAVVGWRSRTRRGVYLGQQMINVMVLTAILGVGFPLFVKGVGVDNWGHAGGAIIGALVALRHHYLGLNVGRPRAFELGMLSLILMLGCGLAQGGMNEVRRCCVPRRRPEIRCRGWTKPIRSSGPSNPSSPLRIRPRRSSLSSSGFETSLRSPRRRNPITGCWSWGRKHDKAPSPRTRSRSSRTPRLRSARCPRRLSEGAQSVLVDQKATSRTIDGRPFPVASMINDPRRAYSGSPSTGPLAIRTGTRPRPSLPSPERQDEFGHGLDAMGKVGVIAAEDVDLMRSRSSRFSPLRVGIRASIRFSRVSGVTLLLASSRASRTGP